MSGGRRADPEVYFTVSHFDGWAAVLCQLDRLDERSLVELAEDAWAARAPKRLLSSRTTRS
ncbi:hypothetical protein [Petropleomorpha daqingensis]|uniref:hypothetical protein n=1 Tax=Petropleomorpha daqingensis TaxID=2026353 RepID=UPI0015C9E7B2|nr:hypothetical protein [Petropleomorpha daqingensis]